MAPTSGGRQNGKQRSPPANLLKGSVAIIVLTIVACRGPAFAGLGALRGRPHDGRPARQALPREEQPVKSPLDSSSRVLVVGASRGLGLEFVKHLIHRGCEVIATHRPGSQGKLSGLLQESSRLRRLELDVASEASIQEASQTLQTVFRGEPRITHIIHNAGVLDAEGWELEKVEKDVVMRALEINTVGPLLAAKHFTPLMAPAQPGRQPVLALVTSKVGSVEDNGSGGGYAYRASKAALNIIAKSLSIDLAGRVSVVLLHPGYVRTDMTGWQGLIDVTESVAGMLRAVEATDAATGFRWVDYKAELIPW